ncbi:MAG: PilN domain-containing protein [Cellulosilyticum sp.]|nr:PilN domain-containing protein [Cellulosilyticum sp.]MEE1072593.1 PilN domain-containing protein [Cellulosilyticum sp.]
MINLLPKEYVQAQKKAKSKRVAMIILIIEVICFIYKAVIGPKLEFRATEIKLERLTTCLNADRYIEINNQIRELEDERIEVQQWDEKYNRLSRKSLVSKQTLDCLLARVPTGLWINVLSISNAQNEVGEEEPQISIEGIAEEEIQLINYMTILEQSFGIGNVQDEIVLDKEKNMYQYTLTIRMFDESETLEDIVEMQDGIEGGAE